jgi:fructokinase
LIAGVDAGGFSFKCALATADGSVLRSEKILTRLPEETIAQCRSFFLQAADDLSGQIVGLGLASFGPLDVDPSSPRHGALLNTPKAGWSGFGIKAAFAAALAAPVTVETDVNAALLAEMAEGAAKQALSAAYMTVGGGIGVGLFANGGLIGAPYHPEFGHIRVERHPLDDPAYGRCPFHGGCLEGRASAAAFAERFGDPETLPADHVGWEIEAFYLAQACLALQLGFRLERIVLGGGLSQAPGLVDRVRTAFAKLCNGYLGETPQSIAKLIAPAQFGADAGLAGALLLARRALG